MSTEPRFNHFLALGPHGFHRVAYTEWGNPDGLHLVVCVHGLTRNSRDFDELAASLADRGCRVACMDVVGRGESDWLEHKQDYGFSQYLSDAAALLARLTAPPKRVSLLRRLQGASEGPRIDWVGTSMGGLIGMMLAARRDSPIRRLVLNDVGPMVPWNALARLKLRSMGAGTRFASLDEVERHLRDTCVDFGPLEDRQWHRLAEHDSRRGENGTYTLTLDPAIVNSMRRGGNAGVEFGNDFLFGIDLWFAKAGHEVSLAARGAHLEAIRRRGLTLISGGKPEVHPLRASSEPADFGAQDTVFVCLKTHSIAAMLPRLKTLVAPDTMVIPAINGLPWWYFYKEDGRFDGQPVACLDPAGTLFRTLDPRHILGCVVHAAAEVPEPGVVRHTAGRLFLLGEPDRTTSARAERLVAAMDAAGFEARQAEDIRVEMRIKLIGNLSYNPVAALALAHMNDIHGNEALLALIRKMMEEAMRVAAAYGVRIPMTVDERIDIARQLAGAKISMHQDVEKRRPLETDAIIVAVVELARKAEIATPLIDAVYALIAERAKHLDR